MAYRSLSNTPSLINGLITDRFTQMDNLFSRLTGEKPISDTPAYNLLQNGEQHELTISLPGYLQDEIDVSVLNNELIVRSNLDIEKINKIDEQEGVKWLHQGIKKNNFNLNFTLEHRIIIKQANLINGLLTLHFTCDTPEYEKPQKITIGIQDESKCIPDTK